MISEVPVLKELTLYSEVWRTNIAQVKNFNFT